MFIIFLCFANSRLWFSMTVVDFCAYFCVLIGWTVHTSLPMRVLIGWTVHTSLPMRVLIGWTVHTLLPMRVLIGWTVHTLLPMRVLIGWTVHTSLPMRDFKVTQFIYAAIVLKLAFKKVNLWLFRFNIFYSSTILCNDLNYLLFYSSRNVLAKNIWSWNRFIFRFNYTV